MDIHYQSSILYLQVWFNKKNKRGFLPQFIKALLGKPILEIEEEYLN